MLFNRLMSRSLTLGLGIVLFAVVAAHAQPPAGGAAPAADEATSPTKALPPSTVLVKVNGEPITQGDVTKYVNGVLNMQLRQMGPSGQLRPEDVGQLRAMIEADAREKLISTKLFEDAVKPYMKKVTDKDIQNRFNQLKKLMAKEGHDLDKELARQRVPKTEVDEKIRQQLAATKFIEATQGPVEPTEKEIKEFIEKNKDRLDRPEEIRTSHILIAKDEQSTGTAKVSPKEEAEQVRKEILAGGDFTKLAAKYSDDPGSKDQGGDVSFIHKDSPFVQPYKDAAFALKKIGDISPVTESQYGYHIIKLTDKKPAQKATVESVGEEVRMMVMGQKMMEATPKVLEKLRSQAKIEVLVPETKAAPIMNGSRMNGDRSSTMPTQRRPRPRPRSTPAE